MRQIVLIRFHVPVAVGPAHQAPDELRREFLVEMCMVEDDRDLFLDLFFVFTEALTKILQMLRIAVDDAQHGSDQGRFTGTVFTDHTDDRTGRYVQGDIV